MTSPSAAISTLELARADAPGPRRLAGERRAGRGPVLVWLGGFRSDMRATKAEALAAFADARGQAFLRFDYTGHGESGGRFADATLSTWLADTLAMIEAHAGAHPVLIGSSMGGWLALLAARALAGTDAAPAGLVLIAPAVDFTEELMWASFPPEIRRAIEEEGVWHRPSAYAPDPTPITRALIEDGRRHLLFGRPIEPGCPVAILQGMADPDVPHAQALRLMEHLPLADASLTLVRDGDHRLSRPEDLALLTRTVARLLDRLASGEGGAGG
jgi:pimeloyl-ACP methyl ester carboxylesterase